MPTYRPGFIIYANVYYWSDSNIHKFVKHTRIRKREKMNLKSEIMGNQNDKRYRVPNDIGVISSGEASENVSFIIFLF